MIIQPPYAPALANVLNGNFVIPQLNWAVYPVGLGEANLGSFRAIFTTLQNCGFGHVAGSYLPDVAAAHQLEAAHINVLEAGLLNDISVVITNWQMVPAAPPTDADLEKIAIGIQLWGGRTARNLFVQDGGFHNNFSFPDYRQIIGHLLPTVPPGGVFPPRAFNAVLDLWQNGNFNQIGVSFATKHLSFWSRGPLVTTHLPIYDSVMAKNFMGRNASWRDYTNYVNGMRSAVALINATSPELGGRYTVNQLERQLFVWAGTPAARAWDRA